MTRIWFIWTLVIRDVQSWPHLYQLVTWVSARLIFHTCVWVFFWLFSGKGQDLDIFTEFIWLFWPERNQLLPVCFAGMEDLWSSALFRFALDPDKPAHIACLTRSLSVQVCGISLLLPPKKLIGNMDRDFIAERQRGLQAYLDSVTQHPLLSSSLLVKKFLDPNSYSANYTGMFAPYRSALIYTISI